MHLAEQADYPALVRRAARARLVVAQLHIDSGGSIFSEDLLVVSEGAYVGDPIWPCRLSRLLASESSSSLSSLAVSVGAGLNDYASVQGIYSASGYSLRGTALEKNFQRLYQTLGSVDLIDLAVADGCHQASFVCFCQMLSETGFVLAYSVGNVSAPVSEQPKSQ